MPDWNEVLDTQDEHEYAVEDLVDWLTSQTWSSFAMSLVDWYVEHGYLTSKQEEAAQKMRTKTRGVAEEIAATDPVTEEGMYRDGAGTVFRVKESAEGHLYAKRLRVYVGDEGTTADFVYESGAIRKLTAGMKMTLEEAKAFGLHFGVCCVCGAELSNPESVAAGIGPICAKRVCTTRNGTHATPPKSRTSCARRFAATGAEMGPCLECGENIDACVRKVMRTDRGCCRWCAHPSGDAGAHGSGGDGKA